MVSRGYWGQTKREANMAKHTWQELKEVKIEERKNDAARYLAKGFELAENGDYEAAERFFGYAAYQVERVFKARKGFKLKGGM